MLLASLGSQITEFKRDLHFDGFDTLSIFNKQQFNPILPGLGKDVVTRGGGHYGPPWFFGFGATKSPKLNLGTFLGLKTT